MTRRVLSEASQLLNDTRLWELLAALAAVLVVGLLTWLIGRWLAPRLTGKTRFGLRGLDRLAAPVAVLVGLLGALASTYLTPGDTESIDKLLGLGATVAGFWLGARAIDVAWATIRASARLRTRPKIGSLLVAARHVGKLVLALAAASVLAVQLGAGGQLYVILAAAAAGLAFAARDPIRNAVAFASMALDPPFHVGDRVRISDYRSGEDSVGTVIDMSLTAVSIRTRERTTVVIANIMLPQLRIENLSAADRRRLELEIPVGGASTEALRDACAGLERELHAHPQVSPEREPHVWLAGASDGLRLKISLWLRRDADQREVQRDVLLAIHDRLAAPRVLSEPAPTAG